MRKFNRKIIIVVVIVAVILPLFFLFGCGNVGGSAKKVGLRIKELERIYGISKGNNQHSSLPNNSVSSQEQLAKEMGISVDTLQNYKKLTEMIPELEELVDTGIATPTTALAIMKNCKLCQKIKQIVRQNGLTNLKSVIY